MTRDQLEHAIRAACDVSKDTELWIFGSQAILAEFPDAPKSLRASIEVDVQPKNRPERTDDVDGALGELSIFHKTHGFYVHGISIESAKLPEGWEQRTVSVSDPISTQGKAGFCVEAHDLGKDPDYPETLFLKAQILWEGYRDAESSNSCLRKILVVSPEKNGTYHKWALSLLDDIVESTGRW